MGHRRRHIGVNIRRLDRACAKSKNIPFYVRSLIAWFVIFFGAIILFFSPAFEPKIEQVGQISDHKTKQLLAAFSDLDPATELISYEDDKRLTTYSPTITRDIPPFTWGELRLRRFYLGQDTTRIYLTSEHFADDNGEVAEVKGQRCLIGATHAISFKKINHLRQHSYDYADYQLTECFFVVAGDLKTGRYHFAA